MHPTPRSRGVVAVATLFAVTAALAGCGPADDGRVQLDFFQFKGEAAQDFRDIVADFEAANPDIDVVINQVPDPDTALRTLLVKDRVPDVLTVNGSAYYGDLAKAGIFYDFSGEPIVDTVNPAVLDILDALGTAAPGEINALPMANNALGVIYNREIFAEHGLEVPTTWDELMDVCERLKAAGVAPFYATAADAWTTLEPFLTLGPEIQPDDFFPRLREEGASVGPDSSVSFQKDYPEVFEKMGVLYDQYAQDGWRSRGYDDGNAAFARGESAMYVMGIWSFSQILANDPDIELGMFPMPGTDDPEDRLIVTGVDVAVTIGRETAHPEEALRFVNYLLSPETVARYTESQVALSPLADAPPPSFDALREITPFFEAGKISGFLDHQIPAAFPLQQILQQFFFDADATAAMERLDKEWARFAARSYSEDS